MQLQMWICLKRCGYNNEGCGYIQKDVDITYNKKDVDVLKMLFVTKTPQPLRIASIDHRAYQPSTLLTIKPINHQAY